MSVLGLDVGTSGCKAIVVDERGIIKAKAYRDYRTIVPHPGHLEIKAYDIWDGVQSCIREVTQKAYPARITAMCLATMGDSFVAVDKEGEPVCNFILASDTRAIRETALLVKEIGREKIYTITGMPPHPINTLTKILWMKRHDGESFSRSAKFFTAEDFIISQLGVRPAMSHSNACRTMGFNIENREWSSEMLTAAGITEKQLSITVPSGSIVGEIPRTRASQCGLNSGVKVVAGGMDQACGSLGSDAIRNGQIEDSIGTVEALSLALNQEHIDQNLRHKLLEGHYSINAHVIPGKRLIMGLVMSACSILKWYGEMFLEGDAAYAEAEGLNLFDYVLSQSSNDPVCLILLPFFVGSGTPSMNPLAKGVLFGLDLSINKRDVIKAIFQGIAHEVALNLDHLESLGIPIRDIKCVGGGAQSNYWLQVRADLIGKPVTRMKTHDAAVLGAAILAGVGTGVWESYQEAIGCTVCEDTLFETRQEFHNFYRSQKLLYRKLQPQLSDAYAQYQSLLQESILEAGGI